MSHRYEIDVNGALSAFPATWCDAVYGVTAFAWGGAYQEITVRYFSSICFYSYISSLAVIIMSNLKMIATSKICLYFPDGKATRIDVGRSDVDYIGSTSVRYESE